MSEIKKLNLKSKNITEEQQDKLKELFPEAFTEGGKIDFDKLKLTLGEDVDTGEERFGMTWPGKRDCFKVIQAPSIATLKPCKEESVNWDSTENMFIEGDNLEVLKQLQKSYYGTVKMIYIDPPYNTGNEFIYPDKYSESLETYLAYTGQVDAQGRKFSTNTDTDGRFHSKWLNMMYPRLFLARNLLRKDGVIFISIDDNEVKNLRVLCDEIFGEENFITQIIWEKTRKNDARFFSIGHDYMVVYGRNFQLLRDSGVIWREQKPGAKEVVEKYRQLKSEFDENYVAMEQALQTWYKKLPASHPSKRLSRYKHIDRWGPWRDRDISWPGGGGPRYDVIHPRTGKACKVPERGWVFSTPAVMQQQIDLGLVVFREDETKPPIRKAHIIPVLEELNLDTLTPEDGEEEDTQAGLQVMPTVLYKQAQVAIKFMRKLMGGKIFDNPKDHEILKRLVGYVSDPDSIVVDFFAGSCATAHAVIDLNMQDRGNRKFIMVQLPEPCKEKTEAYKAGYKTIADIGKERIQRVIKKIETERVEEQKQDDGDLFKREKNGKKPLDLGFKVFKLAPSNFKVWDGTIEDSEIEQQLEMAIDHIDPKSTEEDILYEILLKSGFELTMPITKLELAGKSVYSIAGGELLICLEKELTQEVIQAITEKEPHRVVCLDSGFAGNDQLKTNAVQIMKSFNVENFRTV